MYIGYLLSGKRAITVEATKSETATSDTAAFEILREVTKYVTPDSPTSSQPIVDQLWPFSWPTEYRFYSSTVVLVFPTFSTKA
jgi:hypothetical protein